VQQKGSFSMPGKRK